MQDFREKFPYVAVLQAPHAVRTFGAALIGRFSYGVVFCRCCWR